MDEDSVGLDSDAQAMRQAREEWQRKTLEEIRAAVTRGATGIEACYLIDEGVRINLASAFED